MLGLLLDAKLRALPVSVLQQAVQRLDQQLPQTELSVLVPLLRSLAALQAPAELPVMQRVVQRVASSIKVCLLPSRAGGNCIQTAPARQHD